MSKVFLGGTCNGSDWRVNLISLLEPANIDYFNPVVDDWTEEHYERELQERKTCDYVLYVITSRMTGVYSIAEVVDDSNKRPEATILMIQEDGFDTGKLKSLNAVKKMIVSNGSFVCSQFSDIIDYINRK